jgi:AraC-like DNA-binding protein
MSVLVDTSVVDSEHRAAVLHSVLTGATAPHDLQLHGRPEKVHAVLQYWQLTDDVAVLHQASSGITHTRDERHAGQEGPSRVVFVLHDGGPGTYTHEGRPYRLDRGGLYVTDLNSRYSYSRPGDGVARIIQVERSSLELTMEQVQEASQRLYASPLYNLLRRHVLDLCHVAPELTVTSEAASVGEATVRLAGSLLRTALTADEPARRDIAQPYLRDRAMLFIKLNFAVPELDAEMIADAHGISTRYLYKLWSGHEESLGDTIMRVRLEAARQMIVTRPGLSIGAISAGCGFANASHFSRRFRDAFGMSPREARVQAAGTTTN